MDSMENGRSSPIPPKPISKDPQSLDHSTLEADNDRWIERDGRAAPLVGPDPRNEKILGYHDGKIRRGETSSCIDGDKEAYAIHVPKAQEEKALPSPPKHTVFGLTRKRFLILFFTLLFVVIPSVLGGTIGGYLSRRHNKGKSATEEAEDPTLSDSRLFYSNTGIAAAKWNDLDGTLHKRLYYQGNDNKIRESAWDNTTSLQSPWAINLISDTAKPGTPIAAVAGYPHASRNFSILKNVYFMDPDNVVLEHQARSSQPQNWTDGNLSGLFAGTDTTHLTAYWNQNFMQEFQQLVVLFQGADHADRITQARYTSNRTLNNPWIANDFEFPHPAGSVFALCPMDNDDRRHLMLYTVNGSQILQRHGYMVTGANDIDSKPSISTLADSSTDLRIDSRASLAVLAQDNRSFYAKTKLPECARNAPLTHLIFYTGSDRSSLVMSAWNCTTGFEDHTTEIMPLQKTNATFLALATTFDRFTKTGDIYILYDSGHGPQVEEWAMPLHAGDPWNTSRPVTVDFNL